ncbi:MAG: ATP-binding protein [Chloroflexota bacterium]
MKKLRTRFGLALSIVLLVATLLPILLLYALSSSGLIEAIYVTESLDARQVSEILTLLHAPTPLITPVSPLPGVEVLPEDNRVRLFPQVGLETGQRLSVISYDPVTGLWISPVPSSLRRVVLSSSVFRFRIDLPAWLALGSLPLISLLIGISLSAVMSRSVTKPVSQLADAAQAIGRRDLGYRVETKGSEELRDLAQSFNRMAEGLEHAELTRRNLLADVAHELRTPLAVLDGNLRAMLDGVHAVNEEEVALLYEQTRHLNCMVDDLRELSLAEADQLSLNRQEVDFARLVKEAVAHFDLLAQEQGIQLTTELDDPLVHPSLDDNRIRQILHNLLSNTFRYTPTGGKVTVSAKRSADQKAVEISITDSGAGISTEELAHIFDRFYRTEETVSRDRGGTGLGLAIVKAIVEAQGGRISAESGGRNRGSTFSITFPL